MTSPLTVDVVMPALNEEPSVGMVLEGLAPFVDSEVLRQIIVADNGSTDRTADVARACGAVVVHEPEKGYGAACLKALGHLAEDPPHVVLFLDADHSDDPEDLPKILKPIEEGRADMVIGSRALGSRQRGALTPQQRAGNAFAGLVLTHVYKQPTTDLGPFRAIRYGGLMALNMRDRNWGWTVEMQIKAARMGLRTVEVPVSYRRRVGVSKVSGTLMGTINASRKILFLLARHAVIK